MAVNVTVLAAFILGVITALGVFMGILNSYNRFGVPAMVPIGWKLVIIGMLVIFSGYGVKALAGASWRVPLWSCSSRSAGLAPALATWL